GSLFERRSALCGRIVELAGVSPLEKNEEDLDNRETVAKQYYAFDLDKVVPRDHLVRRIDSVIRSNWCKKELAPYYSDTGRPSIDPVLMIRMLTVGYVFPIRS